MGIAPARWCAESRQNVDNPRGFFEPRPLVWENERILNWLDASWDCPLLPADRADWTPALLQHGARSGRVLRRCQPRPGPWFWKDPRLSLLLDYWDSIAAHEFSAPTANGCVLFVVRNPSAVAASLERRNRMEARHALDLWRVYNASAAAFCRHRPTFLIDYDHLIAHQSATTAELMEWLRAHRVRVARLADQTAVDRGLRRSSSNEAPEGAVELEAYVELAALRGPHARLPCVSELVDRDVVLRIADRRDQRRHRWERRNRVDRQVIRRVRRAISITPAAAREIIAERRSR